MTNKRQNRTYKFRHNERDCIIEMQIDKPTHFDFRSGVYVPSNKEKYATRAVARIQKNLRQSLYNRFIAEGRENYFLLVIDAPTQPRGATYYVELSIFAKSAVENNMASNETLCREVLDEMMALFEYSLSES